MEDNRTAAAQGQTAGATPGRPTPDPQWTVLFRARRLCLASAQRVWSLGDGLWLLCAASWGGRSSALAGCAAFGPTRATTATPLPPGWPPIARPDVCAWK